MQQRTMNHSMSEPGLNGARGFALPEMLIGVAIIAIVCAFAFMRTATAEKSVRLANAQREFAGYPALITALLVSILLLVAGGALLATTSRTTMTTFDASAEEQAYYGAEAGLQATPTFDNLRGFKRVRRGAILLMDVSGRAKEPVDPAIA
ncbi:MAG: prepilin-type N-terminal cleavage/methylation domain-containing protein [Acidobacteriota bacterium]|nr:prepilin-type N-terminal cleavage/methylation domain-containing protein [Acidobacteriota bacterium]